MASITFDESRWPLVVITFGDTQTDAEFEDYLQKMSGIFRRRSPTVTILDASASAGALPKQRKRQADWLREHQALLRAYAVGTAFVITSTLVRGMLTAILWLQPLPQEHVVVATLDEADQWGVARLRTRGIAVPPRAA